MPRKRGGEEARPRPLFVVGSKRSGSTLMANLLNAHPRVFVSHESDVLWILYQARNGRPARYVRHPLDSELMMDATVWTSTATKPDRRGLSRRLTRQSSGELARSF